MHSIAADLIVTWIIALVLFFTLVFFGSASIQDKETEITTCGGVVLVLLVAIAVTIGQLVGWIGVW